MRAAPKVRSIPKPYTPDEDVVIARMYEEHKTNKEIAEALGRTAGSISMRKITLRIREPGMKGIRTPNARERPCMTCRKTFRSAGPNNCMCNKCRKIDTTPFDYLP